MKTRVEGDRIIHTYHKADLQALTGRCQEWSPTHKHGPDVTCHSVCTEPPHDDDLHMGRCGYIWRES